MFAGRCALATDLCRQAAPALEMKAPGHLRRLPLRAEGGDGRMTAPLLEVNDLKKHFFVHSGLFGTGAATVYAVDGVSFNIEKGETLALVGESGCGKSTVGRCILRLFDITGGQVMLDGRRIDDLSVGALRPVRRRVQVVFQDPFSSLNPRLRVRDILAEPMRNFGLAKSARRSRSARCAPDGRGAPAARCGQPLAARVLRRPTPAHRHRPRAWPPSPTSSSATRQCRRSTSR